MIPTLNVAQAQRELKGKDVRVHWHFRKRKWSVATRERVKGRLGPWIIAAHVEGLMLHSVQFKVSEAGRQRVLAQRRKNVHAYVYGAVSTMFEGAHLLMIEDSPTMREQIVPDRVRYNPYEVETFVLAATSERVDFAGLVWLDGGGTVHTKTPRGMTKKKSNKKRGPAEKGAKFETREQWLNAAAEAIRPLFDEIGAPEYPRYRVSCGWPKGGRRAIGQAWSSTASGDETAEVFISPELEKMTGYGVVDTLLHEMIHVIDHNENGHKGPFRKMAKDLGLSGKMTATFAEGALEDRLLHLVANLGPYPHAQLSKLTVQKQSTRMLLCQCPGCGCKLRMTQKWLDDAGTPTCGCGTPMEQQ